MLTVKNVSFAYNTIPVLKNINFTIEKGKHVALIGASGCGKSTLLKIIYGLLDTNQGTLFWDDQEILGPAYNLVPGQENMKFLSQGFELQAYRTVSENIGQYLSNFEPELKIGRVNELLEIVEMLPFSDTKVENLSGGQKQRVALAKALAKRPELLLLDEPFGNIDNFRRSSLRRNLFTYLKRNKITSITATHDKTDILSFAEETIVIHNGEVISKGNTKNIYNNPENYYIASLFGEVNQLPINTFLPDFNNDQTILLYPHELQIVENSDIKVRVKKSYFNGNHYLIEAIFNNKIIFIEHPYAIENSKEVAIHVSEKTLTSRTKNI
ncbi:ABC transporter ATP-binding protein [Aquimarina sp. MMG015]|uniref:ABC transporter ATP-binding protein n=1 Tax=unclassified Aquimarina TaxID=2627091 RepID=UPI000E507D83|nr:MULTISPECIES: ABC transporter ATP-binding protein [unclassified Aquimarina]AXT57143.1 ABC transporter ATP-binding protein [Aquimarina sp. AD1]MBQ4801588.1 ABC transporter ATP-binding protein [Aquimarina sp. MMG015]RKN37150.1 ATP-binding cassette domain-containing protein [Aquimarina sp. AD1]